MTRDFVFGGITLALAAAYYAASALIPQSQLDDTVGPGGLPKLYAIVLAGLSLILIVRSLRATTKVEAEKHPLARVAGLLFIGVLYVVAAPWLGYIVSLAALILATTYYQGGVMSRYVGIVAVTGALFFWLLFVFVLGIPQPSGFWPSLF